MNTDGRIYKTIVVSKPDKYTDELKERIEELGSLCLNNLNQRRNFVILFHSSKLQ